MGTKNGTKNGGIKVADSSLGYDPVQAFEDFFRFYQKVPNEFEYRKMILELYGGGGNTLVFVWEDLRDYDPKLSQELLQNPEKTLEDAVNALKNLLRIEAGGIIDESMDYFVRIKSNTEKPTDIHINLRNLLVEQIDKLVHIRGYVIRMSAPKPQIIVATFECQDCGHQFGVDQYDTVLLKPAKCLNPGCNNKSHFILVSKVSKFIDWQSLMVQENPEELSAGKMPRGVQVILTHNLVDRVRPGDRIILMGIFRSIPQENSRGAKSTIFKTYVHANNIESLEGAADESNKPTEEELVEILRLSKECEIQKKIARSIAPEIKGHDEIKMGFALALFGGVRKKKKDGKYIRGDIHVLTVGDPGTGKSVMIQSAILLSPRGLFASGKGSSAAGLTAAVMKDSDTGGMALEAGIMVLTDGGVAGIDEFDKMRAEDRSAIHEALEQQTISIAKAGIVATLNARTSVLAAANPHLGRYNAWKTASENIRLSPPILSRFDLIFLIIDTPDAAKDRDIAEFIYDLHQSAGESCTGEVTIEETDVIPPQLLKKYIAYAKENCSPKLPNRKSGSKVPQMIVDFYVKFRGGEERSNDGTDPVGLTPRNEEGLIRLSEAHAKMALKEYVDEDDVDAAIDELNEYMKSFGLDPDNGKFDIDRIMTGVSRSQVNRISKMWEVLKDMEEENGGKPVEIDQLKERLELEGVEKEAIEEALKTLKREGDVIFPKNNLIKSQKNPAKF